MKEEAVVSERIIECRDVTKQYFLGQTRVDALKGVSFIIGRGEFSAIAGPSGSGKSTILNILGCIDQPTSGSVAIGGTEVSRMNDKDLTRYRRSTVSFIFQSFNLIPVLNVFENIELPLLMGKEREIAAPERRDLVMRFVEAVGLQDRLKNKPGELSGGQRQRVAIARALVTSPLMVLADEPTANLDSETGERIIELMKDINRKDGTTFIFSTHDAHIVEQARRVIRVRDGLIVSDETRAGEGVAAHSDASAGVAGGAAAAGGR